MAATLPGETDPALVSGTGAFVIEAGGVAGIISVPNLDVGGVSAGGSVLLRVNSTGASSMKPSP
jgi:hypothetical protein